MRQKRETEKWKNVCGGKILKKKKWEETSDGKREKKRGTRDCQKIPVAKEVRRK